MNTITGCKGHETEYDVLAYGLVRISYKLLGGDRMSLTYGTDVKIHGSEIHMICHIRRNPGSHLSGIARQIHVTRGAVSQIVSKLVKKGLVCKQADEENGRRILLSLTEKGEKAYMGHQRLHGQFNKRVEAIMKPYDQGQSELIDGFVKSLEAAVDELIEEVYAEDFFETV